MASELTAFTFLFLTGNHFLGLPVLGGLLVATYATDWRLPVGWMARWGLRAVLFAAILLIVGRPKLNTELWYLIPEYVVRAGFLLSGEVIVRAWQGRDRERSANGILLLLGALIMILASNTARKPMMLAIAPIYILFTALSLRSLGGAHAPSATPASLPRRLDLVALRAAVLIQALVIGAIAAAIVSKYYNAIDNWSLKLFEISRTQSASAIGFSDAPHLSRVFNPEPSTDRVVLIEGPPAERHLRMAAFDTYDHTHWLPTLGQRPFVLAEPAQLTTGAGGQRLHITRLADTTCLLVPTDATAIESPAALERDDLGSLHDHDPGLPLSYDASVRASPLDIEPLCQPPTAQGIVKLLKIPPDIDPRVTALARQTAGTGDPASQLFHIAESLRSTHAYSLTFDPVGEPLNDFILNHRAAHCQYFASAMTMMSRAAGIPACMVTGFYAHEPYGNGAMVVRQRDAHAWCECWIPGTGWVTIDATPAGGRPDSLFPQPSRWQQWRERISDIPTTIRQWLGGISRGTMIRIAVAILAMGVGYQLALSAWRYRRTMPGYDGYASPSAELAEIAERFEKLLRRRGIACASHRTWREHVAALNPQPDGADFCLQFIDTYERARFGHVDGSIGHLRESIKQCDKILI